MDVSDRDHRLIQRKTIPLQKSPEQWRPRLYRLRSATYIAVVLQLVAGFGWVFTVLGDYSFGLSILVLVYIILFYTYTIYDIQYAIYNIQYPICNMRHTI